MAWCVAVGCKSRSGVLGENNELIYFHYFPTDSEQRAQWIKNVRRGDAWKPNKYSRLCSLHFEKSCFQNGVVDNSLLEHAVPTIFPTLPPLIEEKMRKRLLKADNTPTPKKMKLEITLPANYRTEFKKYEKLLMMVPYYERCRCCLRKKNLLDMWSVQAYDGQEEVYGEMLAECFAMNLQQPAEHIEQICISCVGRLRAALAFKRRVVETDKLINQRLSNENIDISQSNLEANTKKDGVNIQENINQDYIENEILEDNNLEDSEITEECPERDNEKKEDCADWSEENEIQDNSDGGINDDEVVFVQNSPVTEENASSGKKKESKKKGRSEEDVENLEEILPLRSQEHGDVEYLELEFLEDDEDGVSVNEAHSEVTQRPMKKKKIQRLYTKENIRKCLDAVKKNILTRAQAAARYGVPSRTIYLRLRAEKGCKPKILTAEEKAAKQKHQEALTALYEEIKTILTYTNATPFKTNKHGKYFCAYCNMQGASFQDPKTLREHTKTKHSKGRIKGVDVFMRPPYLNEVLRMDIENLKCIFCNASIISWNDMFNHLNKRHNIELDQAHTKVIPFKLNKLNCVLCNEKCQNFQVLSKHMNVHYHHFKCSECSETFLNEARLKTHKESHAKTFQCQYCPKVFVQEAYRKRHVDYVHDQKSKHKCKFCPERFRREYSRHLHMMENHGLKAETYTCEVCGNTFNRRPYYLTHMRLKHKREKKHQCTSCGKKFDMAYELRNHENWHKGTCDCVCVVCGRKFVAKHFLRRHCVTSHTVGFEVSE